MNSNLLITPQRILSFWLAGLLSILMPCQLVYAAGATGPPGLQGLDEILIQIIIYPFIGVALAFIAFKVTNKAWAFLLVPFFYWGASYLIPIINLPTREEFSEEFTAVIAWLYMPVIIASAICYGIYRRTKKAWLFLVVPVLGWILQSVSLIFIIQ